MVDLTLKVISIQRPKNACHVLADTLNHLQFFLDVSLIVGESSRKSVGITAEPLRMLPPWIQTGAVVSLSLHQG